MLLLHPDFIRPIAQLLSPETMVTSFNRGLYQRLLRRSEQGLLVDLSVLSAEYEEEEMSYVTRMVREAGERTNTLEEAKQYAEMIREESHLRGLSHPETLADDQIGDLLQVMRQQKK